MFVFFNRTIKMEQEIFRLRVDALPFDDFLNIYIFFCILLCAMIMNSRRRSTETEMCLNSQNRTRSIESQHQHLATDTQITTKSVLAVAVECCPLPQQQCKYAIINRMNNENRNQRYSTCTLLRKLRAG